METDTKEIGLQENSTGMAFVHMPRGIGMKASGKMTRNAGKVHLSGPMVTDTKVRTILHGTHISPQPAFALQFEGEWKDDDQHGQGEYIYANGNRYKGQWDHDKKDGIGTFTWATGNAYKGEWRDDVRHGKGHYKDAASGVKKTRWYNNGKLEREEDCHGDSDGEDDSPKYSSKGGSIASRGGISQPSSKPLSSTSGTSDLEDLMREVDSIGTNSASLLREIETLGELDDLEKEIESLGSDGDGLAKEYSLDEELAFLDSLTEKKK